MPKITLADLEKIREKTRKMTFLREDSEYRAKVTVHMGTCGIKGHAPVKYSELTEEKTRKIFDTHVLGGTIVNDYAMGIGSEKTDA